MEHRRDKDEGLFVVFEGTDGAGTTTQSKKLRDGLLEAGHDCHWTCEPSSGPVGKLVRRILSGDMFEDLDGPRLRQTLALLFAGDRVGHLGDEIEPRLGKGHIVISDRYYHSSLVYQADWQDGRVDSEWVEQLNGKALIPDVTFFLDIPADISVERLKGTDKRDIYEKREHLEKLVPRYRRVMQMRSDVETIHRIDATAPIDEVAERIRQHLASHV